MTALLVIGTAAGGCSESYKFQQNAASNVSADSTMPLAIDDGFADNNAQECNDHCEADGQSSGGT